MRYPSSSTAIEGPSIFPSLDGALAAQSGVITSLLPLLAKGSWNSSCGFLDLTLLAQSGVSSTFSF